MTMPYERAYAAQMPVLGVDGQERLRRGHIHVVGVGRVGSNVCLNLAAAGVGSVSGNDAQSVEPDNLNSVGFRNGDLGAKKVKALHRRLAPRHLCHFSYAALPIEAAEVDGYIERADLVICCANSASARLSAEEKALRYRTGLMQVAAFDGRVCRGGLISVRLPANSWSACAGCYLQDSNAWPTGGGLLSTVTSTLAAIAANMAVAILSGTSVQVFQDRNLFYVDLDAYAVEAFAVKKRSGCQICGRATLAK